MRQFIALSCFLASCVASAAPPVYRCEANGRIGYSDAPCVGAKVIDATPTQGIDKMSGQSRKGMDVQRAEMRKALADAVKPLTGRSAENMEVLRWRGRLPIELQIACGVLDRDLPTLESDAKPSGRAARVEAEAEVRLYQARKRFFDLGC